VRCENDLTQRLIGIVDRHQRSFIDFVRVAEKNHGVAVHFLSEHGELAPA
jgi:hypothetical protein